MSRRLYVALFFLCAGTAFGQTTGNEVLNSCQITLRYFDNNGGPVNEHYDAGWCSGWVTSVLELNRVTREWSDFTKAKPSLFQFCVPQGGIPAIQAVRIIVKYLKGHPEQLHENGMSLTIDALRDAFPCK
jgi:hypothetical protein